MAGLDPYKDDLYRITSPMLDAAVVVDRQTEVIRETSPPLRYLIGGDVRELLYPNRAWVAKYIPPAGYEALYGETLRLLRMTRTE